MLVGEEEKGSLGWVGENVGDLWKTLHQVLIKNRVQTSKVSGEGKREEGRGVGSGRRERIKYLHIINKEVKEQTSAPSSPDATINKPRSIKRYFAIFFLHFFVNFISSPCILI